MIFGVVLLIIVVAVGLGSLWYGLMPSGQQTQSSLTSGISPGGDPTLTTCIVGKPIVQQMKITLRIILNGTQVRIPSGIGITPECTRPLYTKDTTGSVYVESPVEYAYTLGDFFAVWKQPFNQQQLFFLHTSLGHQITMTVNGVPNNEFGDHVLQDGETITIMYT